MPALIEDQIRKLREEANTWAAELRLLEDNTEDRNDGIGFASASKAANRLFAIN